MISNVSVEVAISVLVDVVAGGGSVELLSCPAAPKSEEKYHLVLNCDLTRLLTICVFACPTFIICHRDWFRSSYTSIEVNVFYIQWMNSSCSETVLDGVNLDKLLIDLLQDFHELHLVQRLFAIHLTPRLNFACPPSLPWGKHPDVTHLENSCGIGKERDEMDEVVAAPQSEFETIMTLVSVNEEENRIFLVSDDSFLVDLRDQNFLHVIFERFSSLVTCLCTGDDKVRFTF
jgi:hypothetical protein